MANPNAKGNPQWKRGISGNPGGRPKLAEGLRARALKAVDETVIDAWIDECEKKERDVPGSFGSPQKVICRGRDWVKCSELLAAYGLGKPVQPISGGADGDEPVNITVKFV